MGVKDGAAYCRSSQGFTHTVKLICTRLNDKFPVGGPHNPGVGVNLSCWLVAALKHNVFLMQKWGRFGEALVGILVKAVANNLKLDKQPALLPTLLLCGGGGYVAFETLTSRVDTVAWQTGEEGLDLIRDYFPKITEDFFTSVYGIRDSSRERCSRHLQGGSFDLEHLNLCSNMEPDTESMVVKSACAPCTGILSNRCAVKLAEDIHTLLGAPESRCDCAAGAFCCAHRRAQFLLMYIIQKCDDWDFATLVRKMPEPIHRIVSCAIAVSYCHPSNDKEEAARERKIRQKCLDKLFSQLKKADGNDEDEDEEEENERFEWEDGVPLANPGCKFVVSIVSGGATVEVIKVTALFLAEMEEREKITGRTQKHSNAMMLEEFAK
ncbi:unnamed protein product [Cylindrotheca closterium]|uniref:Uncharacterized protein n=1 Tax=Cylindrotheca closterium TaxID=2856 RepID=A0AAD2FF93_9STRA|nr:unnamed protein product [Cylindrotheca closterium]